MPPVLTKALGFGPLARAVTIAPTSDDASHSEKLLREFLRNHPTYTFQLVEYMESTRFTAPVWERFEAFRESFRAGGSARCSWSSIRQTVEPIARRIPAYSRVEWEREDYWRSIPLIDKSSLRSNPDDFVNPDMDRATLWRRPTSGTTGPPITIWFDPVSALEFQLYGVTRAVWLAGALTDEVRERAVFCCTIVDNKYLPRRVWTSPDSLRGLFLQIPFDERNPHSICQLADELCQQRPAILSLKPSVLECLLSGPPDVLRRISKDVRLIVTSGCDLDERVRQSAERSLGVSVCNSYGLTEIAIVASECDQKDGLHVYQPSVLVEIRGADGELHDEGRGELVISSVQNSATPLLRYCTGDLVELVTDACGCGRPGPRLRNISGRILRHFVLPDGSHFAPTNFNVLFELFPIRELRLTQSTHRDLDAELEFLSGCEDPHATLASIRAYVETELRGLVRVNAIETTFGGDGKFQRYRSLL